MLSTLLGFMVSLAVVLLPIFLMSDNQLIYISIEGIVVVIGGTLGIALTAYPFRRLWHTTKAILSILRKEVDEASDVVKEIIELAVTTKGERIALQREADSIKHPFLKEGVQLIIDRVDSRLEDILVDRIRTRQENGHSIINVVRTLGKFPPALGLLATVLSLVTLLQNLGGEGTGVQNLGPSMAIGLVGTLYGIVIANLIFAPVAENLSIKSSLDTRNRQIAMVGVLLLRAQESPLVVQESLNAMLDIHQRVDVLGIESVGARQGAA